MRGRAEGQSVPFVSALGGVNWLSEVLSHMEHINTVADQSCVFIQVVLYLRLCRLTQPVSIPNFLEGLALDWPFE